MSDTRIGTEYDSVSGIELNVHPGISVSSTKIQLHNQGEETNSFCMLCCMGTVLHDEDKRHARASATWGHYKPRAATDSVTHPGGY